MRRLLVVLVVYGLVAFGAWAGWGLWGWVVVTLAAAAALERLAVLSFTRRGRTAAPEEDGDRLVELTAPILGLDAEQLCRALEEQGIRATYFGRPVADSRFPGGPSLGSRRSVRVTVFLRDAERAATIVRELEPGALPRPAPPEPAARPSGPRIAARTANREAVDAFGATAPRGGALRRLLGRSG
jgi:hypothetical protein